MEERTTEQHAAPFSGRLLASASTRSSWPTATRATREVVEHPGAVGILAWDGERLAHGAASGGRPPGSEMLEIPAGTLEPGESPRVTAERELGEECGLAADALGARGRPSSRPPASRTELLTLFLATGLRADRCQRRPRTRRSSGPG